MGFEGHSPPKLFYDSTIPTSFFPDFETGRLSPSLPGFPDEERSTGRGTSRGCGDGGSFKAAGWDPQLLSADEFPLLTKPPYLEGRTVVSVAVQGAWL